MCNEGDNRLMVERWFKEFWGAMTGNLSVVDELADSAMLLQYSLTTPRHGRVAIKAFRATLRAAFPDLDIRVPGEPVLDREMVTVRWTGNGTHTGPAFNDFGIGPLPAASGRTLQLAAMSAVRVVDGRIVEEAVWQRTRRLGEPAVPRRAEFVLISGGRLTV